MEDKLNAMLNALGAVAEMSYQFYTATLNSGATEDQAMRLTEAFIRASMTATGRKEQPDEQ